MWFFMASESHTLAHHAEKFLVFGTNRSPFPLKLGFCGFQPFLYIITFDSFHVGDPLLEDGFLYHINSVIYGRSFEAVSSDRHKPNGSHYGRSLDQ
jgi:hypothetical protein